MPKSRIQVSNISLVNPIVNSIKRLLVYKIHLSKQVKNLIQLLLGTTLLMANFSFAALMFPLFPAGGGVVPGSLVVGGGVDPELIISNARKSSSLLFPPVLVR